MTRVYLSGLSIVLLVFIPWAAMADERDLSKEQVAVKKLAQDTMDATVKGDFAKVIDQTIDSIVQKMGGRDKAIQISKDTVKAMKAQGFTITKLGVGQPGEFVMEGTNTFTVIPTTVELQSTDAKIKSKGYLLGLSTDGGKSWKFADGAGLKDEAIRREVLPRLPAKLKFPAREKPEVIPD
jgi:hypothetical protein